jgi:hypothetical protein
MLKIILVVVAASDTGTPPVTPATRLAGTARFNTPAKADPR